MESDFEEAAGKLALAMVGELSKDLIARRVTQAWETSVVDKLDARPDILPHQIHHNYCQFISGYLLSGGGAIPPHVHSIPGGQAHDPAEHNDTPSKT